MHAQFIQSTNAAKSTALLQLAAEQGYEEAQLRLGKQCMREGAGKDVEQGLRWLEKAAAQGLGAAM